MTAIPLRRRVAAATAGVAVVVSSFAVGAAAQASTPSRTAATAVDTTYLSDTLGLPSNTVVETVTYDRFQWLLKQSGQFAFVIGSASDAGFAAKVQQADLAAKAAGATKIYWFDPNLTGLTGVRNLDTRNPAGINLAAGSQTIYGNIWKNVLGQYLGNGIKALPDAGSTNVAVSADDAVVNDSVNPVWDYRSSETAAVTTTDDVFFVYDKDHKVADVNDKVVDWVNLTTAPDAAAGVAGVFTTAGGGAVIDQLSQFQWWKDSANKKHDLAYTDDARYGGNILDDSDDADGFRVKQITYPELIHLLNIKDDAAKNFVLLFGGTWCHNTRAVIKDVNREAQENNVATVYNFDLVLDGGTVNGTNGGSNPIHVRDNANSGATFNFRPSYVYGDVVRTYFKNLITEYDPNTGTRVSYYPGGDLSAFPDVVRKLQVPFLINYQRGTGTNPSSAAVKRQWIQQNTDASTGLPTFKEYMTEWWFAGPSAQLGLNFAIPADETTLTGPQQTQLAQARAGRAFAVDGIEKLDLFFGGLPGAVTSTRTVAADSVAYGTAPTITLGIANKYGRIPAGTATLNVNGVDYPQVVAQNAAQYELPVLAPGSYPFTITYPTDAQLIGFTETGTLEVTKAAVTTTGGALLLKPTTQKTGSYKVTVTPPSGLAVPTGDVTVTLTSGATVKTVTGPLSGGEATLVLPKLPAGTWTTAIAYGGDSNYATANAAGSSITTAKVKVTSVTSVVVKTPTTVAAGSYKVVVTQPSGLAKATGKVTVTLTKGTWKKTLTGTLSAGAVTITVPKLPKGTWTAKIAYAGDANYLAASATGKSVVVIK